MIGEIWDSLRSAHGRGAEVVVRRVRLDAKIGILAAMRKPGNVPMLVLEIRTEALPAGFTVPDAGGFSTTIRPDVPGPKGSVVVELELLEASGEPVFMALVDDVLSRVGPAESDRKAAAELSLCLRRWQAFFRAHGFMGLTSEQQQGLFGELLFLRGLMVGVSSLDIAIRAWTGPSGSNQDFEYAGHAFEVKTTASNPLSAVRVSNLRQLDDECVDSLHLVVVEVERHENAEGTLPEAVEQMRRLVLEEAPHMAFDFADRLTEYGYLDQHAKHYSTTGYGVRAMRVFDVVEGFPRLIESNVPAGVGDVKYSVALSAIGDFERERDDLEAQMGAWFGELG